MTHPFAQFVARFEPEVEALSTTLNRLSWILETTGSEDASLLKAEYDAKLRSSFSDPTTYKQLVDWDQDPTLTDPILKRELNILIRAFKQNQLPHHELQQIARRESQLSLRYVQFRPLVQGKPTSENQLREILKTEPDISKRKEAWCASKEVGALLAPDILALVHLRNSAAQKIGYSDFFQMQLELQEVDRKWLLNLFDQLSQASDAAYSRVINQINTSQAQRFGVPKETLGPWAWSEPFGQEDPLDSEELDGLLKGVDLIASSVKWYDLMGFDVRPIIKKSDMLERPGKNAHAFCTHIDRRGDVRTLNNLKPTLKWLETLLHELGHAVYELGFDSQLPWLLREPPHMIPTEAMALLAGRQAYLSDSLPILVGPGKEELIKKAESSLQRRQLIFSRFVLVMTAFESELYRDPTQDLNALWWQLVQKYQKIQPPANRTDQSDWAAKYHIGMAPAYYFSYLVGELLASAIVAQVKKENPCCPFVSPVTGQFLKERLFAPGNKYSWATLTEQITGKPLNGEAWLEAFAYSQ